MPDYRASSGEHHSWRRANALRFHNPRGVHGAYVEFFEEDVVALPGDKFVSSPAGSVSAAFDPGASFPLVNPETGEPTGEAISHLELYVILHSLYLHVATERDAAVLAEEPV